MKKIAPLTRYILIEKFPKPHSVYKGKKFWYDKDGDIHSINGFPAIIFSNGTMVWYKHGKVHREGDLPAIIKYNGTLEWYKNGLKHRDGDRPAYVSFSGTKIWYENDSHSRKDTGMPYMVSATRLYYSKTKTYKDGTKTTSYWNDKKLTNKEKELIKVYKLTKEEKKKVTKLLKTDKLKIC